jgi:nucleotide-binding universal stress UspA family protein
MTAHRVVSGPSPNQMAVQLVTDHGGYRGPMASTILLCTDGSDEASGALSAGLDLLGRDHQLVLVTVMDAPDEASLAGSGHAGPDLSPKEFDDQVSQARETAESAIGRAQSELDLMGVEIQILRGDPGAAICQLATQLSARAIVVGSRGRGGLKRAFLGSVSDHVVRNAPCSVVVTKISPS